MVRILKEAEERRASHFIWLSGFSWFLLCIFVATMTTLSLLLRCFHTWSASPSPPPRGRRTGGRGRCSG